MKKTIIIVIVVILIIALIIGGTVFMLTRPKKAVLAEEFKTLAEEKGYIVSDTKSQFESYEYIKTAQVAVSGDYTYLIEFYTLSDEENSNSFYNKNKSTFEALKQENSIQTETNGKNYETYSLKSGGKYMYIARVNDTILYINVNEAVEENVKELVKKLGY